MKVLLQGHHQHKHWPSFTSFSTMNQNYLSNFLSTWILNIAKRNMEHEIWIPKFSIDFLHLVVMRNRHYWSKEHERKKKSNLCTLYIYMYEAWHVSTRAVSHCGLAIYIKKYLKPKKNYRNSNISPYTNIIFKKFYKRNQIP